MCSDKCVGLCVAVALLMGCKETAQVTTPQGDASPDVTVDASVDAAASTDAAMEDLSPSSPPDERASTIVLPGAEVKVVVLEHGSFYLETPDALIAIDPVASALKLDTNAERKMPDLILVTDIHGDHMDVEAINALRGDDTIVIAPQAVVDLADGALANVITLANGEEKSLMDGKLGVLATPMYNIKRKPEGSEDPYHVKGRGNGYVLGLGKGKIYISGDTECTPEMKALEGINAAFVTMNLPYTMPVEEAAECIKAFKPAALYPFHYRGQDPSMLEALLGPDSGVEVRLLEWYPSAPQ